MARYTLCLFTIVLFCSACQGNNESIAKSSFARFGDDNRYFVYTRSNPRSPEIVSPTLASVRQLRIMRTKTVIVVHDLKGSYFTDLNPTVTDALLTAEDVSVMVVDWSGVANRDEAVVIGLVPAVGEGIANMVSLLVNARLASLDNLHLVGFGVGAHVAAVAARKLKNVARITGLDPAGGLWSNSRIRLDESVANYVEVIHTDSSEIGISDALGHVDFYPNGGISQPGCGMADSKCHHHRSWEIFAATLTHNALEGSKCSDKSDPIATNCLGYTLKMGNNQLKKYGDGSYFVETSNKYPYAINNCLTTCDCEICT